MFFGHYDYTMDAKGRVNFPARYREQMGPGGFVILQWVDHCLFAFSMQEMEKLAERLGADELMNSWETTGDLFSTAYEVEPDKQGRILLTEEMRRHAGLEKNVTFVGNCKHVEIWDTAAWRARHAATTNEQRVQRLKALRL